MTFDLVRGIIQKTTYKCTKYRKGVIMKRLKKLFAVMVLSLSMFATSVSIQNAIGTQAIANASTIKLSRNSLSLKVGESSTLKVNGTKKTVKWSSSNKAVATVTKKGRVTAVSSGTSYIKAKVGKKTLSCKVVVKSEFSASEATKKISVTLQDTRKGVVAILKNNNNVMVDIDAKLVYYSNGRMIDTSSDFTRALESGRECALFFYAPMNSDDEYVSYDDYRITLSVDKASYEKSKVNGIDVESNRGADNVTAEVFNNSDSDCEFIKIAIVFYDSSNSAIGYDYTYANCEKSGSVDYISFDYPYDRNYDTIYPSSYKIYVNEAYSSAW